MSNQTFESNVVILDVGADEYDDQIRSYQPPPHLVYRFKNPGTVAVGQRPNHEDPTRVDVSGEFWKWKNSFGNIVWDTIVLIHPLKEAMKACICYYIENGAWGTAYNKFKQFKAIQDVLKDPLAWPWSQAHVLHLLAAMQKITQFSHFKNFYLWAEDMHVPGFTREIAHRIKDIPFQGSPSPDDESPRTRKHVLSLAEERLLRDALKPLTLYEHDPIPPSGSPEAMLHFDQICGILGYGKSYRTNFGSNVYRIIEERLGLKPVPVAEPGSDVGYFYRMDEALQAIRRYHLSSKLDYLRRNIATHLAFALGARPSQITGINEEGFKKFVEDGITYYSIDVPRKKKREEGKPTAKRRKFPPEIGLGQKIEAYMQLKREAENEGMYERPVSGPTPLFYGFSPGCWKGAGPVVKPQRPSASSMAQYILHFVKSAGVDRTAKDLRANVAQRLADAGYSAELIKEVLDHERLDHIKAYIQASLGLSEILEKALATHEGYQEHVAKLRGIKIIPVKDIPKDANVISGTVNHRLISGIGGCDRRATGGDQCEQEIVYSCYGCDDFHPFDDVPTHQQVLKALEAEVVETMQESDPNEPVKLAFSHQETILRVKAIIQLVKEGAANE